MPNSPTGVSNLSRGYFISLVDGPNHQDRWSDPSEHNVGHIQMHVPNVGTELTTFCQGDYWNPQSTTRLMSRYEKARLRATSIMAQDLGRSGEEWCWLSDTPPKHIWEWQVNWQTSSFNWLVGNGMSTVSIFILSQLFICWESILWTFRDYCFLSTINIDKLDVEGIYKLELWISYKIMWWCEKWQNTKYNTASSELLSA